MGNLSPRSLLISGAGAAFLALLTSPLAQADVGGAYTDVSNIYSDAAVYDQFYGLAQEGQFYSDLTSSGNLLAALGIGNGSATAPGIDASADVNAIAAEGNTLTADLTALHAVAAGDTADFHEFPVIGDMLDFQGQVSSAIAELPAITAQDQADPLLVADLTALYGNEISLENYVGNLGDALAIGSPAEITSDNAAIIADALGIANEVQGTADTITLLADLSSLGL